MRLTKHEGVQVVETAALSENWVCRGSGTSYNLFNWKAKGLRPNADYTLVVQARSFAGENAFNALVMLRRKDGKIIEGYYPAKGVILGAGFREYRFPFQTTELEPESINFYKAYPTDVDKGVDIASVKILEGKQVNLEILPIFRGGRSVRGAGKLPVAGTEVDPSRNPYGKRAQGLNVLAIGYDARAIRNVQEAFAGLNVDLDVITGPSSGDGRVTGDDQDIFYSDSDAAKVLKRLEENAYGLYVILGRAAPLVGEQLFRRLAVNVEKGAGLAAFRNARWGRFDKIVAATVASDWKADDVFPYEPKTTIKEGSFGQGRVLFVNADGPKIRPPEEDCGISDFPYQRFADMWMAKAFYRTAGVAAARGVAVKWIAVSRDGAGRAKGQAATVADALSQAKAAVTTSGHHVLSLRAVDGKGFTADCAFAAFDREGPSFVDFKAIADSVSGDAPARFAVGVDAKGASVRASWTLEDFSGRVLERGEAVPGTPFDVPTRALYTNLGILRLRLCEGKALRDSITAPVLARDRDAARTLDDFTASIWPGGSLLSKDGTDAVEELLEDVGIRHSLLQLSWAPYLSLRHGLAIGGQSVGTYSDFGAHGQPSNVRTKGVVNTAAGRSDIAIRARRAASRAARYGVVGAAVCDEPGLVERNSLTEPDEQPENVAEYRRRMEAKYGTIAAFNRRHGTAHASFADVGPAHLADARSSGRFAEYVEWRTFNVDRWCEAIRLVADTAKAEDPTMRLSLFNSFGQTAASGNDYWKLLTKAGLEMSQEYTEMVYFGHRPIYNFDEFYRSFRPDLRVWGFVGYGMKPEQIRFAPWWFAAHRYGGMTWFSVWTWEYQLFDMPTLALTRDAALLRDALRTSRLEDGLGALMLAYPWAKRDIALYYSHESMLVSTALGTETRSYDVADSGPLHDYMFSRQGITRIVESLLHQHDFVAPEQVVAGKLDGYRIVFLPRIVALSDAEVAALKAFAAKGGRIVADATPGVCDELGMKRPAAPFAPNEITVLGENFDERLPESRRRVDEILKAAKVAPVLESPETEKLVGREAMRLTDGTNSLYVVLRMPGRSDDAASQTFSFAKEGYVTDLRAGKSLGRCRSLTTAVPSADAACWSVCAGKATALSVDVPGTVSRGTDLKARLALKTVVGAAGTRLFAVTMIRPDGTTRFHLMRKLLAPDGRADFVFRMAFNDPAGTWTLRAEDVLTGLVAERAVTLD